MRPCGKIAAPGERVLPLLGTAPDERLVEVAGRHGVKPAFDLPRA